MKEILEQIIEALSNDSLGGDPWYVQDAKLSNFKPETIEVTMRNGKIAMLQLIALFEPTK